MDKNKIAKELLAVARELTAKPKKAASKGTYWIYRNGIEFRKVWGEESDVKAFIEVFKDACDETYDEIPEVKVARARAFNNRGTTIAEFVLSVKFKDRQLQPYWGASQEEWSLFHNLNYLLRSAGYKESHKR